MAAPPRDRQCGKTYTTCGARCWVDYGHEAFDPVHWCSNNHSWRSDGKSAR